MAQEWKLDTDENTWYDLKDCDKGCIYLNETGTSEPSWAINSNTFGSRQMPGYEIVLKEPLNLERTPIMDINVITIGQSPFEFIFIDENGKRSMPIMCGHYDKTVTEKTAYEIAVNSSTYQTAAEQTAAGVPAKIASMYYGTYAITHRSSYSSPSIRDVEVDKILATYDNGYELEKFNYAKLNILQDMFSGFKYEDGFDITKIAKIAVNQVEWSDKSSITYKPRNKAVIIGKFMFEPISDGE